MTNRPILFVTGHRKGGTTLLGRLFDGHAQVGVYPVDISLLYAYFPCFGFAGDQDEAALRQRLDKVVRASLQSVVTRGEAPADAIEPAAVAERVQSRLAAADLTRRPQVVAALVEAWADYAGLPPDQPCVVKETSQAIHFPELRAALPGLKMLAAVRDPRDTYAAIAAGVARYYAQLGEGAREALASVINRYRMDALAAQRFAHQDRQRFMAIRFEDLVAQPETVTRDVAAFAGIDWQAALVTPTVLGRPFRGNSYSDVAFDGVSAANSGRWGERISDFEAQVIEFWCQDVMAAWGYAPAFAAGAAAEAFAAFYDWYNCRYFYYDSFAD